MPRLPRTCPECRRPLTSGLSQRNGTIRCPECGTAIAPELEVNSEFPLLSTPVLSRSLVLSAPKAPHHKDNPDRTGPNKNRFRMQVLCVVVGLVLLSCMSLLVVFGSGLAFWLALFSAPPPAVSVTPVVKPVANPVTENPPPIQPLPPPKEPIKPTQQEEGPAPVVGALPLAELKAA